MRRASGVDPGVLASVGPLLVPGRSKWPAGLRFCLFRLVRVRGSSRSTRRVRPG